MVTKGIIESLPEVGSNRFLVRIPLFESAGIGHTDDRLNTSNFEATLCYQPGNFKGYNVGDVVYIGFEADNISYPVILGKLYVPNDDASSNSYTYANQLRVDGRTDLSSDTYINEQNVSITLTNLINLVNVLQEKVSKLEDNSD